MFSTRAILWPRSPQRTICFSLFVILAAGTVPAGGSEISSLKLWMDGSAKPRGDQINVSVTLYPDVKNAELEIRAYLVSGLDNEVQDLVKAQGNSKNRDGQGNFRLVIPLLRDGKEVEPSDGAAAAEKLPCLKQFDRKIPIPYAELSVPRGVHKFGYEVRLLADGKLADAAPTELTKLTVSDKTRGQSVYQVEHIVTVNMGPQDAQCFVWDGKGLVGKPYQRQMIFPRPVYENHVTGDPVEGEFLRQHLSTFAGGGRPSHEFVPEPRRTVFFATNREVVKPSGTINDCFGDDAVPSVERMSLGSCVVSIPVDHYRTGDIERPGRKWWFWSETPDPDRDFLVEKFAPSLGFKQFRDGLGEDDMILYVHGFNNTLKDAVLRSAQLQHDLEFPGKIVAFSWPSAGDVAEYAHDETAAGQSDKFLADLIDRLLHGPADAKSGKGGKLHVIACGLGSRVLLAALHDLRGSGKLGGSGTLTGSEKPGGNGPKLGQIILVAPDCDAQEYTAARADLVESCERVTYYSAGDDGALAIPRRLHVDIPIGSVPVFDDKIDTIQADGLTGIFDRFGRGNIGGSQPLLSDLRLILSRAMPPRDRQPPLGPRIEEANLKGCFYWTLTPEPGGDIRPRRLR